MEDDRDKTRDERPSSRREPPRLDHAATEPAVIEPAGSPLDAGRRYTLGAEIARGGMGRVVEATDTLLGRQVALKAALASEPEAVRRFARETAITARLEHPSIVPVYDAGKTADGLPYYVMRKIAGRPLDTLVNQRRTIDDRLGLLPNVLSAVEAVAHAHGRGVLHRDLKPANILVGELGETIVIDWGLAKVIDDADLPAEEDPSAGLDTELKTRAGQVVGTPGFMAPEQLQGEPATRACDVYALGATLYAVLNGEPPHAARSSDEMIALALRGPPLPIEEATAGVPAELAAIVDRAMAYDLGKRYADASALAADLRRFLTGQLVAAHEYSALERALRFVKRHRAAVAVTLIAAAVLAVVAYLSVTSIVRERNEASHARELALVEKRAAEEARASEARRADDLLVSQASALVATNPTVAVALLHQLPATATNWKTARVVLADARARGVPWVLPASGFTSALVVTRDGNTAFSGGTDGLVRRHDLVTRTTRELHRGTGTTLLALAGDDQLLAIADGSPSLVWSYRGAVDRVALERPIEHLAGAGTAAVFHDGKALWMLRHGDRSPSKIDLTATKVFGLSASPDGARVVINAQPEALVVELAPVPRVILRRPSRSMEPAWAASGKHLAIASLQGLDEIDFTGPAPSTRTIATTPNVQAAAYVGLDLYFTTGAQTSYRHHAGDGVVQIDLPAATYSSATSTRDGAVFVAMTGTVAITGRGGTVSLRGPVPRMFRATANANATRFLVAVHDRLLLYDAGALLPRTLDTPLANTTFHGFAGANHYLMAYMQDDWQLFDLATGTSRSLGRLEFGAVLDTAEDGSYVIARPNRGAEPVVLRPAQPVMGLPGARHAVAMSPSKIAFATEHDLVTLALGANQRTTLWSTPEAIHGIATAGPFVVAASQTTLLRHDTRSQQQTTTRATAIPAALDVTADGDVWFAIDHAVWKWSKGGTLARIHSLPRPIKRLAFVAGVGCIVLDDRRAASLIVDAATPPRAALPATLDAATIARTAPLIAGLVDRKLVVYDLEGGLAWPLGSGETTAELSADGTRAATYAHGHVAIYPLDVPTDRAAYQRLLEATTNLRVAGAANDLVWPTP